MIDATTKHRVLYVILARTIFFKRHETFFEFLRKNKIASTRSAFERDLVSLSMIFKAKKRRSTLNCVTGKADRTLAAKSPPLFVMKCVFSLRAMVEKNFPVEPSSFF